MSFYPSDRIALFIDGPNLYGTMQTLGWQIDFTPLFEYFSKQGRLLHAYYFTALKDEGGAEHDVVRKLTSFLANNGWIVMSKVLKVSGGHGGKDVSFKGNMDVDIAVQMLKMAQHIDHAVLFSGDGDFRVLVERLQDLGKRVTVVSSIEGDRKTVADELRRQANFFMDLNDPSLRKLFDRDPANRTRIALGKAPAS